MQLVEHFFIMLLRDFAEDLQIIVIVVVHQLFILGEVGVIAIDGVVEDSGLVEEFGEEGDSSAEYS